MRLPWRAAVEVGQSREVVSGAPAPGRKTFANNAIITSKYNFVNIVPKAIWEQFRRVSNFYFLAIAVISLTDVSPVSPVTTILPLVVVVGFGLARDVYEDVQRGRSDRRSNTAKVDVYDAETGEVSSSTLRALVVGDVVQLKAGDVIPADIVPLASSSDAGVSYISTSGLDGESSLKRRLVPQTVLQGCESGSGIAAVFADGRRVAVRASRPTPALDDFVASLRFVDSSCKSSVLDQDESNPDASPLDDKNLLLRGAVLRNTAKVHGLVVYTGADSKISLNMRHPPSKLGQIERMLNRVVPLMFLCLLTLSVAFSVYYAVLVSRRGDGQWYMGDERFLSNSRAALEGFGTFIILFHHFIPISLFVTLEFVRVFQGIFIFADVHMRSKGTPVTPKAGNLHEVLGNIEHILTDKTGTLTQNVMRFVRCSVGGKEYDLRTDRDGLRSAVEGSSSPEEMSHVGFSLPNKSPANTLVLGMALTHSVVPETLEGDGQYDLEYNGQSPDEVALVESARNLGIELRERPLDRIVLRTLDGDVMEYTLLAELEFSSDRKRMSVIVEDTDSHQRYIYTKGADAVMVPLLEDGGFLAQLEEHLHTFAVDGLRTLVFAAREIGDDEYAAWSKEWGEASNLLQGRGKRQSELASCIERGLQYVGCTAVEDKLQDRVPETIDFMRRAGVRIWVLTGDKLETAENIGYSANLLNRSMRVEIVKANSSDELFMRLRDLRDSIHGLAMDNDGDNNLSRDSVTRRDSNANRFVRAASLRSSFRAVNGTSNLGVIIEGNSLAFLAEDVELQQLFMDVSDFCKTVICARVTPSQKAMMVLLARRWRNAVTLAIGDGGNDVSMIQEAHIGIGLVGKEGSQAALASDYSMGEFRHLQRLLTVHGRYSYVRTAGVINLSVYKNITFTVTQILFQFFTFASGTSFHDQWIATSYNALLTLAGPFLYGIFERDLDEFTLERVPSVYLSNRNNRLFSFRTVAEHVLAYSVWHGFVVFCGVYFLFGRIGEIPYTSGRDSGLFITGFAASVVLIAVVQFKFFLSSHIVNGIVLSLFLLSFAAIFAVVPLSIIVFHNYETEGVMRLLMSSGRYHAVWPLVFVTALIPDFLVIMKRAGILGKQKKSQEVSDLQRLENQKSGMPFATRSGRQKPLFVKRRRSSSRDTPRAV